MNSENVGQAYNFFRQKCQDIIDSQYLMSDTQILKLLRYIANTPCLMEFLAKCNQGLDFSNEFNEATAGVTFKIPQSKKRLITLVTGMLFAIDRKELNFGSFLLKFYGVSDDYEVSYKLFCKSVLMPYMDAFAMILKDDVEEDNQLQDDKGGIIDESVKEQIYPYISAVKELVLQDNSLKDKKRQEFLTMLEGFNYVIEIFNCKMIEVVWIGLKSVMSNYRPVQSFLKSLESILNAFAII